MKEIKGERDVFGGGDGRAINKHSVRRYEHEGVQYELDRNNSGCPPFFTLNQIPDKPGLCKEIKCDFKPGCSWKQAISVMYEKVTGKKQEKEISI